MSQSKQNTLLQYIRSLAADRNSARQSDRELLRAFAAANDQAAFTALVQRHGSMVMAVSRRVLHQLQDAEDVFQATFLLLADKASSLSRRESLAGWLHNVAYRMAANARRAESRRQRHERRVSAMPTVVPESEVYLKQMQENLHEEIHHLPLKYRETFVLFCLENRSGAETAHVLDIKEATVRSRLAKARALLHKSLVRRGVSLSAALAAAALTVDMARAAGSRGLIDITVQSAALIVAGKPLMASSVSTSVAGLFKGAKMTLFLAKLKGGAIIILFLTMVATGIRLSAQQRGVTGEAEQEPTETGVVQQQSIGEDGDKPRRDRATPSPVEQAKEGRILLVRKGRLGTLRPDGSDFRWHSLENVADQPPAPHTCRLSPNGKRVAFGVQLRSGAPYRIYVQDLKGKNRSEDTEAKGSQWCWSHEGTRLQVLDPRDKVTNWLVDLKTKQKTRLNKMPQGHWVTDWSADGNWFLTTRFEVEAKGEIQAQLYLVKTDGSQIRPLLKPNRNGFFGRLDRDGQRVLYLTAKRDGDTLTHRLYVADTKGGEPVPVSERSHVLIHGYGWSPDGERVAYAWQQGGEAAKGSSVVVVGRDGKNPRTLLSTEDESGSLAVTDWR